MRDKWRPQVFIFRFDQMNDAMGVTSSFFRETVSEKSYSCKMCPFFAHYISLCNAILYFPLPVVHFFLISFSLDPSMLIPLGQFSPERGHKVCYFLIHPRKSSFLSGSSPPFHHFSYRGLFFCTHNLVGYFLFVYLAHASFIVLKQQQPAM